MGMNGRKIKNRLRSVNSTKHMTKAMELVASSKLRRATANMVNGREYFSEMEAAFSNLLSPETKDNVYVKSREVKKQCLVVIAGDRGLAGGYNNNVFKLAAAMAQETETDVVPVGKKALEHFIRRGCNVVYDCYESTEDMGVAQCAKLGRDIAEKFANGEYDEVKIVYTKYESILTQIPDTMRILPLNEGGKDAKVGGYMEFSPNAETVLSALVPEYVSGLLYGAVSESFACELSARRNAMDSATKNAAEMIDKLNLQYNRARQAAITQEITEIIGGSES